MTGQREKPDFVVDPSGTVYDVRHSGHGFSYVPPGAPPSNGNNGHSKPKSSSSPRLTPYFIPIPVGLIIFLLWLLVRHLLLPESSANTFRSESAFNRFQTGNRHFFAGDYDKALVYYGMALDSEPDVGEIYNRRGLVFEATGEHDKALADFDRALELVAAPAMVYNNRAITFLALGEGDKAVADLDRAIELQPNLGKAYYNRGIIHRGRGEYAKALADLDQALRLSSERSQDWPPLPTMQGATAFDEMMERWSKEQEALESWADLPSVYYQRGLAYLAKGDYDSAIADLHEAIRLQPDHSEASYTLALAYAAVGHSPGVSVTLTPAAMGPATPTEMDRVFPLETKTTVPFEQPPATNAVYVAQPYETPTTPVWELAQEPCDRQQFEMWISPGRYLYRVTPESGDGYLVAVQQESREDTPSGGECRLPWLNYRDASSTGSREAAAYAKEHDRGLCAYARFAPPTSVVTTGREVETKSIALGTFLAVRQDTFREYHVPQSINDPQGTIASREWYACGYGLIRSWTLHTGKYQGRPFESEYGLELVSFTPLSTNESHVRHILVDVQLSGSVASYPGEIADEETAEALRRWKAGIRVVNTEEFERKPIDGHWQIVYSGTDDSIIGLDVILTTDPTQ